MNLWIILILLAIPNVATLLLGLYWVCCIHPRLLADEQRWNAFKRDYLRQWR